MIYMQENSKKTILIANTHMEIGGIETSLLSLLKNIDTSKYEVDLMLFKMNGELLDKIPENINVFSFYYDHPLRKLFEKIVLSKNKFGKILKHILFNYYTAGNYINRKKEYEYAIDFSGYYGFVDKYIMRTKAKAKAIWVHSNAKWNYDNDKKYRKKFDKTKKKYKVFDKIVLVSDSSRKEFAKLMPEYKDKMITIYNVFSVDKPDKENIPKQIEVIIKNMEASNKYKLISVGRIVKEKSFDRLVDITNRLVKEGYDVETYLIGSGPLENSIKQKVRDCGIEDRFHITGYISNVSDILNIVKRADLFVGTSITEGLPTAIIEALTTGIKIVLPNTFGYIDIYNNIAPKGSINITKNDFDSIYNNVKNIIDNQDNNDKEEYTFDINSINTKTLKKLDQLINKEI